MERDKSCVHGVHPAKKICFSKDCTEPAFANLACEQCEAEHQHGGLFTCQNKSALLTEVETVMARKPNKEKMDKLCQAASTVTQQFNQICNSIVDEFSSVSAKEQVSPEIRSIIERFKEGDHQLTGRQMFSVRQQLANKDVSAKQGSALDHSGELLLLYNDFLEKFQSTIDNFKRQKVALLSAPTTQPAKINPISKPTVEQPIVTRPTKVVTPSSVVFTRPAEPTIVKPNTIKHIRKVRIPNTNRYFDNVADIKPGDENLNLLVKVIKVKPDKSNGRDVIKCVLGDQTGCVKGMFYPEKERAVREGAVLEFNGVRAYVLMGNIVLQIYHANTISVSKLEVGLVNTDLNISDDPVCN